MTSEQVPMSAQMSCRLNRCHGDNPRWKSWIDDADNTITRPSITKMLTTKAMT